jgi:hypothetical protein
MPPAQTTPLPLKQPCEIGSELAESGRPANA